MSSRTVTLLRAGFLDMLIHIFLHLVYLIFNLPGGLINRDNEIKDDFIQQVKQK